MEQTVGIDFGNSSTTVARWSRDDQQLRVILHGSDAAPSIPSVFYVPTHSAMPILVGQSAIAMAEVDPDGIVYELKSDLTLQGSLILGGERPVVNRAELLGALFRSIRSNLDRELETELHDTFISVPVASPGSIRSTMRLAAENAGFGRVTILEEPVAAAYYWLYSEPSETTPVVICDVGAAACRLCLVERRGYSFRLAAEILPEEIEAGGFLIDQALLKQIRDKSFSPEEQADLPVLPMLFQMSAALERMWQSQTSHFRVSLAGRESELPAQTVSATVASFIRLIVDRTESFVDRAAKMLQSKTVHVLLVGRGSRLVGLKDQLSQIGKIKLCKCNNPGAAMSLGCAAAFINQRVEHRNKSPITSKDTNTDTSSQTIDNAESELVEILDIAGEGTGPARGYRGIEGSSVVEILEFIESPNDLPPLESSQHLDERERCDETLRLSRLVADIRKADETGIHLQNSLEALARELANSDSAPLEQKLQERLKEVALPDGFIDWTVAELSEHRISQDVPSALVKACFTRAVSIGYPPAVLKQLTKQLRETGGASERARTLEILTDLERDGYPPAAFWLGQCFESGMGFPPDLSNAFSAYLKAAESGHISAQLALAELCGREIGVDGTSHHGAEYWWRQAAKSGSPLATFRLWQRLSKSQDKLVRNEGYDFLRMAATAGHPTAQDELGDFCAKGTDDSSPDLLEALHWKTLSAKQGVLSAQLYLVQAYSEGLGTPRNLLMALKWTAIAGLKGHAESQFQIGKSLLDGGSVPGSDDRKHLATVCRLNPWLPEIDSAADPLFWLYKSAEQGNKQAQALLGRTLLACEEKNGLATQAVKWLNEAGDRHSRFLLAECTRDGKGIEADRAVAMNQFSVLASEGHPASQLAFSEMILAEQQSSSDQSLALDWLRRSATSGHIPAIKRLAMLLEEISKDDSVRQEAVHWWKSIADTGDPEAMLRLGIACEHGLGTPRSLESAFQWYNKAVRYKSVIAQRHIGMLLNNPRCKRWSADAAMKALKAAAQGGDGEACYLFARELASNKGKSLLRNILVDFCIVSDELEEAYRWYEKSAESNYSDGWIALGWCQEYGIGCKQDIDSAKECYKKAARQLSAGEVLVRLAAMCRSNPNLPDHVNASVVAASHYRKANERGCFEGTFQLALCLLSGSGVNKSVAEGMRLLRLAADANHSAAQFELGMHLVKVKNANHDRREAFTLIKNAAFYGNPDAQYVFYRQLQSLNRGHEPDTIRWLERAANQEHVKAEAEFARKLWNGDGCAIDRERSREILEGCIRAGDPNAVLVLAELMKNK